jgi:hypothetical protein
VIRPGRGGRGSSSRESGKFCLVRVTLGPDTLQLFEDLVVACPLLLDELPELGVLGREGVALGDDMIESRGLWIGCGSVLAQDAIDGNDWGGSCG